MRSSITKGRLVAATIIIILLVAGFLAGAHHGYTLGYIEGENRTNGWWIDKMTHYYESAEVIKKRIDLKHNHIYARLHLTATTCRIGSKALKRDWRNTSKLPFRWQFS